MKAGIIQIHSIPTKVKDNVEHGIEMFKEAISKGAELIIFPELWTCGYFLETPDFIVAEKENSWILDVFKALSKDNNVVTVLPLPQKKDDDLYIGLYVIEKNGEIIYSYQKSFLWGREQNYFVHGKRDYNPIETSVGKLGLLICYDIEFPEPSRVLALKGADLIIVPSVWSIPAMNRWHIQLPARALDNTVFVIGVNNIEEGAGGCSKAVSPIGDVIAQASDTEEEVLLCDIDYSEIAKVREKIPYLKEYDPQLSPDPTLKK